ncbi:MAG: hypothetical protein AAGI68_11990 [Planctomycetota bacterium]
MPSGVLADELDRLRLAVPAGVVGNAARAADAGAADLREALVTRGMAEADRARVLKRHADFRAALSAAKQTRPDRWAGMVVEARRRGLMGVEVPRGLPIEFELYLRGALAWAKHDTAEARAAWRELLGLPAEARQYRGVWAAYMLGMTHMRGLGRSPRAEPGGALPAADVAAARRWFAETRRLAAAGGVDSLGLSAASLGQEGRLALAERDYVGAVRLYAVQHAAGDPTAAVSLRVAVAGLLGVDKPGLEGNEAAVRRAAPAAADGELRRVVTAVLVSWAVQGGGLGRVGGSELGIWLAAVTRWEAAGGRLMEQELSRLAWVAYLGGAHAVATGWMERAVAAEEAGRIEASLVPVWLGAKLAMQAGDLEAAWKGMKRVADGLPVGDRAAASGERFLGVRYGRVTGNGSVWAREDAAVIAVALGRYGDAIRWYLEIGYSTDAAYLAEQVMGIDELRAWVDEHAPGGRRAGGAGGVGVAGRGLDMRGVLGRRLMRAGRYAEAERYLPAASRETASRLAGWVSLAEDAGRPAGERAEAYWRAARLVMHEGNTVLRSWSVREYRKGYPRREDSVEWGPGRSVGWSRLRLAAYSGLWRPAESEGQGAADWVAAVWAGRAMEEAVAGPIRRRRPWLPGRDELERLARHHGEWAVEQSRAFRAAGLAWRGAELMPDGSDELARRLCLAGTWIALRDPQRADRFYKALVRRCGGTAVGQRAAAMRWLPRLRDDPDFAIK